MNKDNIIYSNSVNTVLPRISYLALSSVIRFVVQFAIIIVYSHRLSLAVYGQYQFIWMFINFFSLIMLFGLNSLVLSTPLYEIKNWIRSHIKLVVGCFIFFNAIALGFLFIRGEYFTNSEKSLLVLLLILQNLLVIAEAVTIKREQEKKVFSSNIAYLVIYATAHLYLIYTTYSVELLLLFLCVAAVIKTIILCYNLKLNLSFSPKINPLGRQWFYLGINEVLGVVVKWIDKWAILFFLPVADFAVYFNATYEIPVFMLVLSAVGNISLVELSKPEHRTNRKIKRFYDRSTILMACFVFPSFWFFWFYAGDFIVTFFGDKYAAAITIFKISIFILPARIIYSTTILQIYHKTNLIVKGAVIDLIVALVFIAILYPNFGMEGLALAFVISTYVQVGYYLWETGRLLKEKITYFFPVKQILIICFSSGLLIAISYFLMHTIAPLPKNIIGIVCTGIITLASFIFFYKKMLLSRRRKSKAFKEKI